MANPLDSIQDNTSVADLDGDGDKDVLTVIGSLRSETIGWFENTDGKGTFGPMKTLSTFTRRGVGYLAPADIDGDGDVDVVFSDSFGIRSFENTDGRGTFGEPQFITRRDTSALHVTDFDGDGDSDVLAGDSMSKAIALYANLDGNGTFGNREAVVENIIATSVYTADMDGDGDVDILAIAGAALWWYENANDQGNKHFIRNHPVGARASDIDGDGDVDVITGGYIFGEFVWFENVDGKGSLVEHLVSRKGATLVEVSDLDGDGDMDLVSSHYGRGDLEWYENTDGKGTFSEANVIASDPGRLPSVISLGDIDTDGDMDVLWTTGVAVWAAGIYSDRIAWYENLRSQFGAGDANGDNQFDQLDIVQVLQAGKYRTGESATFEEGDWNGDALFDQVDVILALQFGDYLQGPICES